MTKQIWLGGIGDTEYIVHANSTDEISDGYHTFKELYDHRHKLSILVAMAYPDISFKTRYNSNKDIWEDWFILGMNTVFGQISYHVPMKYWDICNVQEIEYNDKFDGHTSFDTLDRLEELIKHGNNLPENDTEVSERVRDSV